MKTNSNFNFVKVAAVVMLLFCTQITNAQSSLDISIGSSFQDDANAQIMFRRPFGQRFQAGVEFQYGLPKYRFVETKTMREGYAVTASLPFSFRLAAQEKIQLYGIGRIGARFQGIIDPDNNDMRDSILASSAVVTEIGLTTTFKAGENIQMQGGMSFPMAFEFSPTTLQEYTWAKIHLGAAREWEKYTLFAHGNIGSAFGASGDTYKYIWSLEAGVRFKFGDNSNASTLIQASF